MRKCLENRVLRADRNALKAARATSAPGEVGCGGSVEPRSERVKPIVRKDTGEAAADPSDHGAGDRLNWPLAEAEPRPEVREALTDVAAVARLLNLFIETRAAVPRAERGGSWRQLKRTLGSPGRSQAHCAVLTSSSLRVPC
jgi:hypothetical protein